MNDTLLNRFTQAFNGSAVDSAAMNRVYQRWIELRRESLEDLPASLRDEVLSDLVADRARAIADSSAEMRPAQLEHDRIWTEFWPIDKESETFAHQVKAGRKLSDEERARLQADREKLTALKTQIGNLPSNLQAHFDLALSESTLDLAYAIYDGAAPVSMRLGRGK